MRSIMAWSRFARPEVHLQCAQAKRDYMIGHIQFFAIVNERCGRAKKNKHKKRRFPLFLLPLDMWRENSNCVVFPKVF